jgi:anthranilate phosphoribosyltransferase
MELLSALRAEIGAGGELAPARVASAAAAVLDPSHAVADRAALLSVWDHRGATPAELGALARFFLARSNDVGVGRWTNEAVEIIEVGPGSAGRFDVSSMTMLVLACAGLKVMKHGDGGCTFERGVGRLLFDLGYDWHASPGKLRAGLDELGYAYFFTPSFNPDFQRLAALPCPPVTRDWPSVCDVLAAMINPGRPMHVLVRCHVLPCVEPLSAALHALKRNDGLILARKNDFDQGSSLARDQVRGFGRFHALTGHWHGFEFGLTAAPASGSAAADACQLAVAQSLVAGEGPAALADAIAYHAAVAMWIAGRTAAISDAIGFCRELLIGGEVARKIARTRGFFQS